MFNQPIEINNLAKRFSVGFDPQEFHNQTIQTTPTEYNNMFQY